MVLPSSHFENFMPYCLSLADGNNWFLSEDGEYTELVSEFAGIMRLRKCSENGSPQLLFSSNKTENSGNHDSQLRVYETPLVRILYDENSDKSICEIKYETIKYINMAYSLRHIYMRSMAIGGLPFHAGLAELNGRGVLFAAAGGTGKSTCCRRLPSYWKPLCDDEALVVLTKSGQYMAHPFPTWSDYTMKHSKNTWDVQYSVPLSAIFFIEQAETDEIIPMSMGHSTIWTVESANETLGNTWTIESANEALGNILTNASKEEKVAFNKNIFDNAFDIAHNIPAFQFRVSLNGSFWEKIEEVIA